VLEILEILGSVGNKTPFEAKQGRIHKIPSPSDSH